IDGDIALLVRNFGDTPAVAGEIRALAGTWQTLCANAEQVIASEQAVVAFAGNAERFTQAVPQLQAQRDEVVRAMSASGSPSSQTYLALREVVLASTTARRVVEIGAGGPGASVAGDVLARDAGVFE